MVIIQIQIVVDSNCDFLTQKDVAKKDPYSFHNQSALVFN